MREIKFRGKRIDTGEWVYGDLIENQGRYYIYYATSDTTLENEDDTIIVLAEEVGPDTVGQHTGQTDRNGKEIYEGDIIGGSNGSINGYEWPFKLLIKWNDERCGFNTPAWGYMDSTHYYDVIGNIHDNPELLEDGK